MQPEQLWALLVIVPLCLTALAPLVWAAVSQHREMERYRQACRDYDERYREVLRLTEQGAFVPSEPVPTLWPYYSHRYGQKIP